MVRFLKCPVFLVFKHHIRILEIKISPYLGFVKPGFPTWRSGYCKLCTPDNDSCQPQPQPCDALAKQTWRQQQEHLVPRATMKQKVLSSSNKKKIYLLQVSQDKASKTGACLSLRRTGRRMLAVISAKRWNLIERKSLSMPRWCHFPQT